MYARVGRNNISDDGSDPKDLEKNTNSKTWLFFLVSLTGGIEQFVPKIVLGLRFNMLLDILEIQPCIFTFEIAFVLLPNRKTAR